MDERILKWLYDIKVAIEEIESYFENQKIDFFEYRKNLMRKRAVERNLEIIGEAMNRIIKKDAEFKIKDANSIIGLRNQVIHAYESINDDWLFWQFTEKGQVDGIDEKVDINIYNGTPKMMEYLMISN